MLYKYRVAEMEMANNKEPQNWTWVEYLSKRTYTPPLSFTADQYCKSKQYLPPCGHQQVRQRILK